MNVVLVRSFDIGPESLGRGSWPLRRNETSRAVLARSLPSCRVLGPRPTPLFPRRRPGPSCLGHDDHITEVTGWHQPRTGRARPDREPRAIRPRRSPHRPERAARTRHPGGSSSSAASWSSSTPPPSPWPGPSPSSFPTVSTPRASPASATSAAACWPWPPPSPWASSSRSASTWPGSAPCGRSRPSGWAGPPCYRPPPAGLRAAARIQLSLAEMVAGAALSFALLGCLPRRVPGLAQGPPPGRAATAGPSWWSAPTRRATTSTAWSATTPSSATGSAASSAAPPRSPRAATTSPGWATPPRWSRPSAPPAPTASSWPPAPCPPPSSTGSSATCWWRASTSTSPRASGGSTTAGCVPTPWPTSRSSTWSRSPWPAGRWPPSAALDLVLAGIGLVCAAPVLAVCAVAIKAQRPGPGLLPPAAGGPGRQARSPSSSCAPWWSTPRPAWPSWSPRTSARAPCSSWPGRPPGHPGRAASSGPPASTSCPS